MKVVFITNFILIINIISAQNIDSIAYYYNTSQYYKAISLGEKQLKNDSTNSSLLHIIGSSYQKLNKYKFAESFLKKAYINDKKNILYINSYAQILAKNRKTSLAEKLYKEALIIDSCNFASLNNLSKLYFSKKKYNNAIAIYKRLIKQDSSNTYYYRKIANCFSKLKKWKLSYSFYNKAYKIDSTNLLNTQALAYFLYRSKKYDDAIKICNNGILTDSLNSDLYKIKANSYYAKNHFYLAIPQFRKVIALKDSSEIITKKMGVALYETKNYDEALKYNIASYNADSSSYSNTLYICKNYLALNDYENSLVYANKTLKLLEFANSISAITIDNMAIAYTRQGKYKKALKAYDEKHKLLKKRYLYDYYHIAILHDKLNNKKEAVKFYKIVLKKSDEKESPIYLYSEKRITHLLEDIHFEGN
ncbi:MAG: tetratricopeptide repeat protein [Chlorobi bacterium]|nr:tetratricopeptide repeat protein [Chlorobiota bacterium]